MEKNPSTQVRVAAYEDASPPRASDAASLPERTTIDRWGLSLALPAGSNWVYSEDYPKVRISLPGGAKAELERVSGKPPDNPKELAALFGNNSYDKTEVVGTGEQDGVLYQVITFEVRVGFRSIDGRNMHRIQRVTRVHGVVPVSADVYVSCTYALERDPTRFGSEGIGEPAIELGLAMCTSMRLTSGD